MKISSLVELIQYYKYPTCVNIKYLLKDIDKTGKEITKVKRYRYKFDDFADFLEKAQKSEFLKKTSIDELVVQRSLLNDSDEFIMIYCTRVKEDVKDE